MKSQRQLSNRQMPETGRNAQRILELDIPYSPRKFLKGNPILSYKNSFHQQLLTAGD